MTSSREERFHSSEVNEMKHTTVNVNVESWSYLICDDVVLYSQTSLAATGSSLCLQLSKKT